MLGSRELFFIQSEGTEHSLCARCFKPTVDFSQSFKQLLKDRYSYYPHFADEGNKAQGS